MSASVGNRDGVARLRRTATPDNPPPPDVLLEGELSVEMADPMRLWVGVPGNLDATRRRLLFDSSAIGGGGGITISDTPPAIPTPFWWDPIGTQLYVWYDDGSSSQWVVANNTGGGAVASGVVISDTPPASPAAGQLWYDSARTGLYIRYDDGTSAQWVVANAQNSPTTAALTDAVRDLAERVARLEAR